MKIVNYIDIWMRQETSGGYDLIKICDLNVMIYIKFCSFSQNLQSWPKHTIEHTYKLNDQTIFNPMTERFTDLNLKMYFFWLKC